MAAIDLEVEDYVATITLNNPPLNVWEDEWSQQLEDILDSFEDRGDVRVAVITGAGQRAFTAGANVKSRRGLPRKRAVRNYVQAFTDCRVPIIGAINGYALGHGMAIAACCDILVGSDNAMFGLPEIDIGGSNGGRFFMRLFPYGHARYAVYTGHYIDANEAYRVGALFKLVPADALMSEARKLANVIAQKSPIAIRAFRETLRWVETLDVQTGYEFEGEMHRRHFNATAAGAAESLEARTAWLEKRKPVFPSSTHS